MRLFRIASVVLASFLAVTVGVSDASADVYNFSLTNPNSALSGLSGPFGEVSINLTNSTHATVTFTSDIVGSNVYLFGDGSSVGLNVNSTSFSVSGISCGNSGTGFSCGPQ